MTHREYANGKQRRNPSIQTPKVLRNNLIVTTFFCILTCGPWCCYTSTTVKLSCGNEAAAPTCALLLPASLSSAHVQRRRRKSTAGLNHLGQRRCDLQQDTRRNYHQLESGR